ncbi:MAG: DEAD/DEAH box helicase [Pseudomonadales bacterium]|nr:DEAD/DEAH box helicase [Pseudomonadales bacterium]
MATETPAPAFAAFGLPAPLLSALDAVGYETPTPIQAETIPSLLAGHDLLGHAPTGTGKTAAFALPLLARTELSERAVQALVLTPTRELAIQVAEAFQRYAAHLPGFHVVPIYGGQGYETQIRQLKRGVHVVVGTPGRVMDHLRSGKLSLANLRTLVLDEADEMLRMGFLEDVEWILGQTPPERQLVLFSATMPREIERITRQHLREPHKVSIRARTATAETIHQRYWLVEGLNKLDALTRLLEVESFDAMLIFVRTKTSTLELSERLEARGFSAAALNGDMAQNHRELMIARLKSGALDILVATDVAARGLDVERISHVVNYDIPYDTESYIHRIGRTGRAGRIGDAILFVAPRERRMLGAIERATRQPITQLRLPTPEDVTNTRITRFKSRIRDAMNAPQIDLVRHVLRDYLAESGDSELDVAAALGCMALGNQSLRMAEERGRRRKPEAADAAPPPRRERQPRATTERAPDASGDAVPTAAAANPPEAAAPDKKIRQARPDRDDAERGPRSTSGRERTPRPDFARERYRVEIGASHGLQPGNLVGAIANEAGLDAEFIGRIEIFDEHSTVELPEGMPKPIYQDLRKAWVCGRQLKLSRIDDAGDRPVKRTRAAEARRQPNDATPARTGSVRKRASNADGPARRSTPPSARPNRKTVKGRERTAP